MISVEGLVYDLEVLVYPPLSFSLMVINKHIYSHGIIPNAKQTFLKSQPPSYISTKQEVAELNFFLS